MKPKFHLKTHPRLWAVLVLLSVGIATFVWLWPRDLQKAQPVQVTQGVSVSVYRAWTQTVADAPTWLGSLLEIASEASLVILGLVLVWVWWAAFRAKDLYRTVAATLVGIATILAYGFSEVIKLAANEQRPCRVVSGVSPLLACPQPGDWAFPSNHATLAAALAIGLVIVRPRLAAVILPLAAVTAVSRVLLGVHYPHDVLAGIVLGGTVVAVLLVAGTPFGVHIVFPMAKKWGFLQPDQK